MSNGNNLQKEINAASVTRDENAIQRPEGGLVRIMLGWASQGYSTIFDSLPDLPALWSFRRDHILASTVTVESHWAQAVGLAVMNFCTRSWDVDGEVPLVRLEKGRKRIRGVDYVGSFSSGLSDYILRDNGWWIEIVRPTSQPTGVIGLKYLDSGRCMPTGNSDIPCVYWDRLGHPHELRDYQVMRFVDMPDGANPFRTGLCSARKAYNDIRRFASNHRYLLEKSSGHEPLVLHIVSGVNTTQIQGALADHQAQQEAKNILKYGGVAIMGFIQREGIEHVQIPLKSLPDDFDIKTEMQEMSIAYGNSLPLITYLNIMAMTGQRAGSGAQSQVIDDMQSGKEAILRDMTLKFNDDDLYKLMPDGVTFFFKRNDLTDRKREAEIIKVFADAAAELVSKVGVPVEIVIKWLTDNDVLPPDQNPDEEFGSLSEHENPSPSNTAIVTSGEPKPVLEAAKPATKSIDVLERLALLDHESEDDVRASEALQLAKDFYLAGTQAVQQAPSGPNFHLDGVRMDMPEGLQQAMVKAMEKPAPPVVDLQPVADAIEVSNSAWVAGIKALASKNDSQQLAEALLQLADVVSRQKAPVVQMNVPAPVVNNHIQLPEERTIELDVKRDKSGLIQKILRVPKSKG